ncbi:PIN domain nuclease, a component of toxin-antitoxin system (PIN domain) [Methylomagnum ishizawai]|uniref:PIN domain nuclease, a component of toxin-antitoxin system (PIN domain) n=1 Tax=Methylomagnum ishizawai TaxID=1760988 RepID=A0A1Y6CXT2_9GAMM|nr:type II toxin-antitoxin system VapC family toxin [Methylomagnum ishizawai]SMF95167.1 PIN domain nuclease, a component of toxin-antitoxin system (PIN domain) [Methylomagnum ishizawai]
MRHLIDTQILIWTIISPEKLTAQTIDLLQNNEIFVSQISFLEIAIKQKIGKLPELDLSIAALTTRAEQDGFNLLMLQTRHIDTYGTIPLYPNHRDPFDRILLATALSENIPIISADENFDLYAPQIQIIKNA